MCMINTDKFNGRKTIGGRERLYIKQQKAHVVFTGLELFLELILVVLDLALSDGCGKKTCLSHDLLKFEMPCEFCHN